MRTGDDVDEPDHSESGNSTREHARPRKRTRRACDKCSSSRTRCDGDRPCRRCQDYGYSCRYNREVKKRGRLPASASHAETWRQAEGPNVERALSPALPSDAQKAGTDRQPAIAPQNRSQNRATSMSVTSLVQPGFSPPSVPVDAQARNRAPLTTHDSDVLAEESPYPSPTHAASEFRNRQSRGSFISTISDGNRAAFAASAANTLSPDLLQKAPTEECRYKFLNPVLPYLRNIIPASVACELLDIFLTDPGSSLFRGASPYILTRIFRKQSIVDPSNPRPTTPALLATILWCVAQTADVMLLHVPGTRAKVVNDLYDLATSLTSDRDPDRWRRIHGGLRAENEVPHPRLPNPTTVPAVTPANEPAGVIDDVFTFTLLSIAVSGGDFKSDCYKWWSKATRLAISLKLNREDEECCASVSPCANPLCSCRREEAMTLESFEQREERRRVFWLLYSLDRHLALSFNTALTLPDSYCKVYAPLPEAVWENLDKIPLASLPRIQGPPTVASGTGYFEFFLPLMTILGDIIEVHHRRRHPRLGELDDTHSVAVVQELLSLYEMSLDDVASGYSMVNGLHGERDPSPSVPPPDGSKMRLVKAYSTHILHVLYVLLYGKWDAISMLDDGDDWITSKKFNECASHAIAASQSVSTILTIDPELTFMSYLFGIYLLHGSFILLLFADRMPQLGPNPSVEQACENIIRAHEVCVVTLSTEFQKNFRKVLRSTLYSVRGAGTTDWEEHRARRRALSLYRWTKGARGLAL